MMPSIPLRLATMARALEEVILPAIAPGNDLAREQAQLLIAHLGLIGVHWQRAHLYDALVLDAVETLARELLAAADGGPQTMRASVALAECVQADTASNSDAARRRADLAAAIDTLVSACASDGSAAFGETLFKAIVAHGSVQARRDRVWFAGSGMDPETATLGSIDTMLLSRA